MRPLESGAARIFSFQTVVVVIVVGVSDGGDFPLFDMAAIIVRIIARRNAGAGLLIYKTAVL